MPKTEKVQIPGYYYQPTKGDGVFVGPSLPPFVEGQLRCFLHLSIGDLKWNGLVSLKDVEVGVKWWGQQNAPILLKPRSEVSGSAKIKYEAKYPIRSGPKQFTAYLKDMGILSLNILARGTVIGHVDVTDVGLLCHSRPIKGFYSVISSMQSTMGKEIGMLFVSLAFYSVSGSINMESSTIPTIDMPSPSVQIDKSAKARSTGKMAVERQSKKMGTEKKKPKGVRISSASPERIEYSLTSEVPSFVVGPGQERTDTKVQQKEANTGHTEAKSDMEKRSSESYRKEPETPRRRYSIPGREVADTLARLIERGQDLRNKMVLSAVETPRPSKALGAQDEEKGSLLQDILDQIDEDDSLHRSNKEVSHNGNTYSVEQTLVDLVAGDETDHVGRIIKKLARDSDASLSEEFSDIEDPIHEESLLTDLFYTAKSHETSESSIIMTDESDAEGGEPNLKVSALEDAGNKRPIGRKYQRKKDRPRKSVEANDLHRSGNFSVQVDEDTDSLKYLNPNKTEEAEDSEAVQPQTATSEFMKSMDRFIPEGMDLDTVTTLARVQFARVIINTLDMKESEIEKYSDCTFFVEYDFPVNSLEHGSKKAPYSELTRCASTKLLDKSIVFNHRSVFPVYFDGTTIANWWDRQVIFKLHVRFRAEHSPVFIGRQSFALRKIFFSEAFALDESLIITGNAGESADSDNKGMFATLQVSIELAAEKGDVKRKKTNVKTAIDIEQTQKMQTPARIDAKEENNLQSIHPAPYISQVEETMKHDADRTTLQHGKMSQALPRRDTVLKSLLFIREGKSITTNAIERLATPANCYLVCRMFWDKVASKSQVCWNSLDPEFNFVQTVPVALNTELIEKARNNFMVIEVWDKSLSAADDKLIGVVKVSLHPFYMSFKDPSIVKTLLKSQYPVIAVDDMVKVHDLFGDRDCGHLHVLLALGSKDQVENLLEIKSRKQPKSKDTMNANRRMTMKGTKENSYYPNSDGTRAKESTVDHIFGISIENAKNLGASLREEVGERDCFIQYQFLEQQRSSKDVHLIWHKTPTTLFVDNPTFGFSEKHVITSFVNAPVQHLFLSSFEDRRKLSGITFELWQRSYFPNVRDCVLYKTMVPLAKIYAMVAMSKENDSAFQAFKLPLSPIDSSSDMHDEDAKLNIGISYQQKIHNTSSIDLIESKSPCVCIAVSVLRACGLKACLLNQSRRDHIRVSTTSSFNTFVKVSLSFLGAESARVSPVVARSFAPTFSFHIDFPVNVIQDFIDDDEHDESSTLAYHLESGHLIIQIFQKKIKSGFLSTMHDEMEDDHSELLLGDCRIPLIDLLSRNTGIRGWFPIATKHRKRTRGSISYNCDADEFENTVGGLEISLKFGKDSDRELIINTARGIGWSPLESLEVHEESFSAVDVAVVGLNARVSVDKVWIAAEVLEKWSDEDIQSLRIYCRYKFYDHAALITSLVSFERASSAAVLSATLGHKKQFQIAASSALSWYLREEVIEFQFWLRMVGKNKSSVVGHARDKLIGSVFVNASTISKNPSLHGSVSGLYPMYKFGAEFLGKSSARISVHITDDKGRVTGLESHCSESSDENYPHRSDTEEAHSETSSEFIKTTKVKNITAERLDHKNDPAVHHMEEDLHETSGSKCRIIVEEALHLPTEITSQGVRSPSTYASYQITPFHEVFYTNVVNDSTKPRWNVENVERFDLCKVPNQVMNFKVFKKVSDRGERPDAHKDVLLGAASVDLFLLTTGFRQIHGWYNLVNFSGQQVGQIKVGIIPERPLATSPSARYFRRESLADKVYYDMPLSRQVARSLCFEENSFQGNQDTEEKAQSNSGISFDKVDDSRMLDSSKSLLFNKLRDHITDLETLTRDLHIKLKGHFEADPRYVGSVLHKGVEQNYGSAEKSSSATSYVLRGLLNENEHFAKECATISDNGVPKTQKNIDTENDRGFAVDSSNMQPSRLGIHGDDNETSFSPITLDNGDSENGGGEVVEKMKLTKYTIDSDGSDKAFDSFDDVLNYERKNEDSESLRSLVVDDIPEIYGHSQSDDGIPLDDERISRPKSFSVDDESLDSFKIVQDAPCTGNSKQVSLEEKSYADSNAVTLGKEQSPFSNDLHTFVNEQTGDSPESKIERSIASNTPIYYVGSNNEASNDSEKILETLDDSALLLTKGLLEDSSAHEEDSTTKQSTKHSGSKEHSSQSQSKADTALRSDVPNFFMSREMLAKSMQKLRLAVTRDCNDGNKQNDAIEGSDMESRGSDEREERRFDRRKPHFLTNKVKVSLDKPPPLETDEINRIASIFSTKFT